MPAPSPPSTLPTSRACPNCGQAFSGELPKFCPACGQETRIEAPTVAELVQQFGGAYFSTEGALWRTLKLLLLKPGELSLEHQRGRRKHYVLPLRLFLTVSLVMLLVVRWAGDFEVVGGLQQAEARMAAQAQPFSNFTLSTLGTRLGVRDGVFVCEGLPSWLCRSVQASNVEHTQDARSFMLRLREVNATLVAHFGALMFVLLPLFAVCLKLVSPRRSLRYTEHLVFALHLHSFWFIVFVLMRMNQALLTWVGLGVIVVYTLVADWRFYGGPWWQRVLRPAALSAMYTLLLAVAVPLAWLLALLS
jgi:hypothetical protein